MSIVNAFIHDDGTMGLVGVDTEGADRAGAVTHISKMTVLPHLPAVIAIRGCVGFLPLVYMFCSTDPGDLDTLISTLPAKLPEFHGQLVKWKDARVLAPDAPIDALSLVMLGWSIKRGRVIGACFEQLDPGVGFVVTDIDESHISPWHESLQGLVPSSSFGMYDLAKAQCGVIERFSPTSAGGGRFLVARLTSTKIEIRDLGDLDLVRGRAAA